MLLKRSITGTVFVMVVLAGILIHPLIFILIFGTLLFLTQLEFYSLVEKAGFSPHKYPGIIHGLIFFGLCAAVANNLIPATYCLLVLLQVILIFILEVFRTRPGALQNSAQTLFGFIYVAVPFSLLHFLVFPDFQNKSGFQPWILAGIFFIVWVYDSMAYLAGSKFGKRKLCKKISPKKTWEGFIAGTVMALVMGIVNAVFIPSLSLPNWMIVAVLVVISGTFGDVFESKIKRELNIKDSGTILPGHGGFLDRLDSLLFTVPTIFLWLIFMGSV